MRVAVTGLSGSGKTVFLTCLIHHLLELGDRGLPWLAAQGITLIGREVPAGPGRSPGFPYRRYLDDLRRRPPQWPERTLFTGSFEMELKALTGSGRSKHIRLEFSDYPGERLVDVVLLDTTFEQWSDRVVEDAGRGVRRSLSESWLAQIAGLSGGSGDVEDRLIGEYREYLYLCREAGLTFLQPADMLLKRDRDADRAGWFCPLPDEARRVVPALANEFKRRFDDYVSTVVRPFKQMLDRCDRQVVLVDVLDVLRNGLDSFHDMRRCMRGALNAFGYRRRRPWYDLVGHVWDLLRTRIERVAFVASKADQAAYATRRNLKFLLEEMVSGKHRELSATMAGGKLDFFYMSAYRSTVDDTRQFQGRKLSCLGGIRLDRPGQGEGPWFPGEVPDRWPQDGWNAADEQFNFPSFEPKPLPERDGAMMEHINLDKVLYFILEEDV